MLNMRGLLIATLALVQPLVGYAFTGRGTNSQLLRRARVVTLAVESAEEAELEAEEKMGKTIGNLQDNLGSLRTGRANPEILKRIMVEYYGAPTPLNQLCGISTPSGSQLMLDPFDKSCLADIERAIMESNLGLNPNSDGSVIRLNIPQLTEDRRKVLAKEAKAIGEEAKTSIRNIRRNAIESVKKFEKNKEISEDESKGTQDDIQKLTDKFVKNVDDNVALKEKEILKV
jgi:ribosome recycling factor